ncbi:MAG: hypothetical protein IIW42_07180 [Bacteroidaceae bacterium]|nr:hypothetical protein [Bacteroidaceae bacterium]
MPQQLYIKKGNKYMPIDNELSRYEEDCIWMSYRYCIGRHTIAAHMHAGEIAAHAYGRMSDERTQFMSYDINREIAHILNVHNWFEFDNEWSIPKSEYRPLDLLYRCLDDANIRSDEELRRIKNITAIYNQGEWVFDIHYYTHGDNVRSISDIHDLEVWQQLANLFDLDSHKMCRLIDDTFCEYYECWKMKRGEYNKYRIPVDARGNFSVLTYLPDESIAEANVELIK